MAIFSLRPFTFDKIIKKYSNISFNYSNVINGFSLNGFVYNNTLYKKDSITLIRPKYDWFLKRNGVLKFRLMMKSLSDDKFDVFIYSSIISKYPIFLFIYVIPFIFSFAIHFDKPLNKNIYTSAIIVFLLIFIPFIIIAMLLQKIFRKRFIAKIERILFNNSNATAPNKA